MRLSKITCMAAGAFAALTALACSTDAVSSPEGRAPLFEKVNPPVTASALTRDVPLSSPISVSATLNRGGGDIKLDAAGLQVTVPPGALGGKTTITVTALAGDIVAYEFQPHGLVFAKPITLKQDTKGTAWYKLTDPGVVEGGYFKDSRQIDESTDTVLIDEFLPTQFDVGNSKVVWNVEHFSGYMLSTGRK